MEQGYLFSVEVISFYTDDTAIDELPLWNRAIATLS